jgi:hypothetical protein
MRLRHGAFPLGFTELTKSPLSMPRRKARYEPAKGDAEEPLGVQPDEEEADAGAAAAEDDASPAEVGATVAVVADTEDEAEEVSTLRKDLATMRWSSIHSLLATGESFQ